MKKSLLIGLILGLGQICFAQTSHPYIKRFSAQAADGKLFLSWTTQAGFSCQDIGIELSRDSINFEQKGTYFGICGDFEERDYNYTLEDVHPNALNYLRLNLGVFGVSFVISERVIQLDKQVLILPNPVTSNSTFYFDKNGVDVVSVSFYTSTGQLITSLETDLDAIPMADLGLPSGLIIYSLRLNNDAIRGKFFFEQ